MNSAVTLTKLENRRNGAFLIIAIVGIAACRILSPDMHLSERALGAAAVLGALFVFAAFILLIAPITEYEDEHDDSESRTQQVANLCAQAEKQSSFIRTLQTEKEELEKKVKSLDDYNIQLHLERDILFRCNDERLRLFRFVADVVGAQTLPPGLAERAKIHEETYASLEREIKTRSSAGPNLAFNERMQNASKS